MKCKFLLIIYLFIPFHIFCSEDENFNLTILVYNTHGLPEIFIDDNPKMRFPIIGEKSLFKVAVGEKNGFVPTKKTDFSHYTTGNINLINIYHYISKVILYLKFSKI